MLFNIFWADSMPRSLRIGLIVLAAVAGSLIWGYFSVPVSVDCPDQSDWSERAPAGAIWERETIHWDQIPPGYTTLVGWVNIATAIPCADTQLPPPTVELRKIRIIAKNERGMETVIEEVDPRDQTRFVGRLFPRIPQWFGETEGDSWVNIASASEDGTESQYRSCAAARLSWLDGTAAQARSDDAL